MMRAAGTDAISQVQGCKRDTQPIEGKRGLCAMKPRNTRLISWSLLAYIDTSLQLQRKANALNQARGTLSWGTDQRISASILP